MDEKRARFEAQVLPHLDAAYRFARWLSGVPADADDVVQEAILRAFRGFDALRGSDVKAWLLAIVRNCHSTALKQRQRRAFVPLPEENDVQDGHVMTATTLDPEHASMQRDEQRTLDRLIAALPEEHRTVLMLREIEEMDYRQIALVTNVPIGTVMSRLARSRAALREQWLKEAGESRVQCPESLRVQAYFDAEVDAVSAAEIERHIEHCAECRALLKDLEQVRGVLRRDSEYARTAPALRARIAEALDREGTAVSPGPSPGVGPGVRVPASRRRPRSFWLGALGGAGGTAVAATLAFMLLMPRLPNPLFDELVSAHVRSLMPAHLIDVVSTDRHTVKPWFAGHADVSPVVADFEPQGYKLIGGRADYLHHQRSAVVVYQHGAHIINVFSWADNQRALPDNATRSGYHLAFWREGDLDYCAVSDTGWDELLGLMRLLRAN